jgi:hypothetical protein
VNIYENPKLNKPNATSTKIQFIKDILHQILIFFANTEKISKKYKLNAKTGKNLFIFGPDNIDPAVIIINNKMKELVIKRQKSSNILKIANWVLYHRSKFKKMSNFLN